MLVSNRAPAVDRFWARVVMGPDGCHLWVGAKGSTTTPSWRN